MYVHNSLADELNVPVICYGLRTDFKAGLFAGSKRLLEVADCIEEVKTTCYRCNKKAIFNLKVVDGKATLGGESIDVNVGLEEKYLPTCSAHFHAETEAVRAKDDARIIFNEKKNEYGAKLQQEKDQVQNKENQAQDKENLGCMAGKRGGAVVDVEDVVLKQLQQVKVSKPLQVQSVNGNNK